LDKKRQIFLPTAFYSLQPRMMTDATMMPKWAWIIIW
jgi:hypothetical protein